MAYEGTISTIPLGKGGLLTDAPESDIPPTHLILANNITVSNYFLEKDYGSRRRNQTALPAAIKQIHDFWPNDSTQRVFALLKDGSLHRLSDWYTQSTVTPTGSAPATLSSGTFASMVAGGAEDIGRNRKLFVFTNNNPVQVVSGDATTRSNISRPPADWTGTSQPFGGIIHRNRLWAWGNVNNPHGMYVSLAGDHEDFTTIPLRFPIYPGVGDKIVGAFIFRGTLFVFKYPRGMYYLVDSDPSELNWYFTQHTMAFGGASPHAYVSHLNDAAIANNFGSLTSLQASLVFGNLNIADLFSQLKVKTFAKNTIRKTALNEIQGLYYPEKDRVYFSFQSTSSNIPDRILCLDLQNTQSPTVTWSTKDQPNCLALVRDEFQVERPMYGAEDGFIYEMDRLDRWVGDGVSVQTGYPMQAMTPHMDFKQVDDKIADRMKRFDFVDVEYEPTGDWDLLLDIFIDGRLLKTAKCNLSGDVTLGKFFKLDETKLNTSAIMTRQFDINGMGKRIAFGFRNSTAGQNVRLSALKVYFQLSDFQQTR